jgi:hypothetical protein
VPKRAFPRDLILCLRPLANSALTHRRFAVAATSPLRAWVLGCVCRRHERSSLPLGAPQRCRSRRFRPALAQKLRRSDCRSDARQPQPRRKVRGVWGAPTLADLIPSFPATHRKPTFHVKPRYRVPALAVRPDSVRHADLAAALAPQASRCPLRARRPLHAPPPAQHSVASAIPLPSHGKRVVAPASRPQSRSPASQVRAERRHSPAWRSPPPPRRFLWLPLLRRRLRERDSPVPAPNPVPTAHFQPSASGARTDLSPRSLACQLSPEPRSWRRGAPRFPWRLQARPRRRCPPTRPQQVPAQPARRSRPAPRRPHLAPPVGRFPMTSEPRQRA